MGIAGKGIIRLLIDKHLIPIAIIEVPGIHHHAIEQGKNPCPIGIAKVNAGMEFIGSAYGMHPPSKAGGHRQILCQHSGRPKNHKTGKQAKYFSPQHLLLPPMREAVGQVHQKGKLHPLPAIEKPCAGDSRRINGRGHQHDRIQDKGQQQQFIGLPKTAIARLGCLPVFVVLPQLRKRHHTLPDFLCRLRGTSLIWRKPAFQKTHGRTSYFSKVIS